MNKMVLIGAAAVLAGCCATEPAKNDCQGCKCKAAKKLPVIPTDVKKQWKMPFELGLAGYTMCQKSLDETLETMQAVDLHNLCVKDFHLRYDATDAEIKAFKEKCAKYGVRPYALGPLYTKSNEEVRKYFEFAKRFGAKVIVGVPQKPKTGNEKWNEQVASEEQIRYIDQLVKEFDIKYAIHNHGPQVAKMFPDVEFGWKLVKDLDKRIGFCLDIGWEFGCGKNPAETIRRYGDRIYDIHLKNFAVDAAGGRKLAKDEKHTFTTVPMPRGMVNYAEVFRALAEVGYDGVCSLEYEREFDNNLEGIAESIGYARGVCDTIRVRAKMEPVPAGANTLTAQEKADGFELLFDGRNLPKDKWTGDEGSKCAAFPEKGWYVEGGALFMKPVKGITEDGKWFPLPPEDARLGGGGSINTVKKYRDFIFKFDFRLTWAANSGVKYYLDENLNKGTCEEYQILDKGHPDYDKPNASGVEGTHRIGALYDLAAAPEAEKVIRPLGRWNSGMIVAKGNHIEHWLNGVKILEYQRGSAEFRKWVDVSKYATWGKDAAGNDQRWGETPEGRIHLQDHSDSTVYYCNLKIKEL